MTPAVLLRTMRSRGFSVARDGAELVIRGPKPRDPVRAKALIDGNRAQLLALLDAEAHPTVLRALDVFPLAGLVEVRPIPEAHLARSSSISSQIAEFPTDRKPVSAKEGAP